MHLIQFVLALYCLVNNVRGYWEGDRDGLLPSSNEDFDSTNIDEWKEQLITTLHARRSSLPNDMVNDEDDDIRCHGSRCLLMVKLKELVRDKRSEVDPLIVTLAFVVDHAAYQKFNQSTSPKINEFCSQLVNHMNSYLSKLYVKIILADVIIWYEEDSFEISRDSYKTMMDFSEYNKNTLFSKSKLTHTQLLTGQVFHDANNNTIKGRAQLNTICTDGSSSVVTLTDTSNVKLQALFSTHEFAHSLNIEHTSSNCPTCLMAPNAYENPELRHDWTVGNIKRFTSIIEEKPCLFVTQADVKAYKPNACGNGVQELEEECDLGQRDMHNSNFCDAWTCQFIPDQGDVELFRCALADSITRFQAKYNNYSQPSINSTVMTSICHQCNISKETPPPEKPLIVSLTLVVDHTAYRKFDRNTDRINRFCIELVNHMNSYLDKLFLKIFLNDVIIWYEKDSFAIGNDAVKVMNDFELYNKNTLLNYSDHSHAQLITGKYQYDENNRLNLGRAKLNTICTNESSSVVMLHDMNNVTLQAVTNAHELAHAFNIKHTDSNCSECIMAPNAGSNHGTPAYWTASNVIDFMRTVKSRNCLFTEQVKKFEPNSCGNGVLDDGEECDIGQRDLGDSRCCIAWTCRLRSNSNGWQGIGCRVDERQFLVWIGIALVVFLIYLKKLRSILKEIIDFCSVHIRKIIEIFKSSFGVSNKYKPKMPVTSPENEKINA